MSIETIITSAGRRSMTVQIQVESSQGLLEFLEIEPYSRKQRGSSNLLFCLDVKSREYKNIDLARIRNAEMTRSLFKPRFPVDF
jgi:hypothetical protein